MEDIMLFFGILNSGCVILKEKSISLIILHGRIMSNKTKNQTTFDKSMKECLISRLAKHILLIPHAKEQIFVKSIAQNCHIDHQRVVQGSKIVITFWCDIWNLLS